MSYRQSKQNIRKYNEGFFALTATLIISAVLMLIMISGSTSSFFARFDSLGSEFKRVSLGLSESCSNAVLLKISQKYDYNVTSDPEYVSGKGVPVNVGPDKCYIKSVDLYVPPEAPSPQCDPSPNHKCLKIKTYAQYPSVNGSWSTNQIIATVQNPSFSTAIPPPTCSFSAFPALINSGQHVTLQWATAGNATSLSVVQRIGSTDTTIYSGSITGTPIQDTPSASVTYTATITGPGGSTQCVSPQSVVVQPSISCADTVAILSGGMSSPDLANEGTAVKTLLDLYKVVIPTPHVGIGSYVGLDGSPAQVPTAGWLTGNYGINGSSIGIGPKFSTLTTTPNQWTNPNNALTSDSTFATDSTSGHQEAYTKFGFNIPTGATIQGVEVVADGLATMGNINTSSLLTNGIGNYNNWTGNPQNNNAKKITEVQDLDVANFISESTSGDAQTFSVANSAIPAGSIINSVTLNVTAAKTTAIANPTIKLRVEKGLTASDISDDTTSYMLTNTTYQNFSRQMPTNPFTGFGWTLAEVNAWTTRFGVIKTTTSGTANVTQIYVVVNYTPPGSLGVNLSWNNGTNWTGIKDANLTDTESSITSGSSTDTWGHTWTPAEFNDGNFILLITNNFSTGTVSINYLTAKVYYGTSSTGLYQTTNTIVTTINSAGGTDLSAAIAAARGELDSSRHQHDFRRVMIVVSDGKPNRPSGPVDKEGLALDAADTAKQDFISAVDNKIELFTVHFGTASGRDLVAEIASGATLNNPHQPGSLNQHGNSMAQPDIDDENDDDDYFFIAPTSADMPAIFDKIGKKVCPAAIPPGAGAPPPPPPPPPPLPPPISIGSWDEVIDVSP